MVFASTQLRCSSPRRSTRTRFEPSAALTSNSIRQRCSATVISAHRPSAGAVSGSRRAVAGDQARSRRLPSVVDAADLHVDREAAARSRPAEHGDVDVADLDRPRRSRPVRPRRTRFASCNRQTPPASRIAKPTPTDSSSSVRVFIAAGAYDDRLRTHRAGSKRDSSGNTGLRHLRRASDRYRLRPKTNPTPVAVGALGACGLLLSATRAAPTPTDRRDAARAGRRDTAGIAADAPTTRRPSTDAAAADTTAPTAPRCTTADRRPQPAVGRPEALQFTAPAGGRRQFDGAAAAGKPTVFWFWAPT